MRFIWRKNASARLIGTLLVLSAAALTDSGVGARKEIAGLTIGRPWPGERGLQKTTAQIMADPAASKARAQVYIKGNREIPGRKNRPQNHNALPISHYPLTTEAVEQPAPAAPQPIGTNFTGATLADTGTFPPDTMGAVGPSQFVVLVNCHDGVSRACA